MQKNGNFYFNNIIYRIMQRTFKYNLFILKIDYFTFSD